MSLKKPPRIQTDSRIGLILPASGPLDPIHLTSGIAELRRRGFDVVFDDGDLEPTGYLSAPDGRRSELLNALLRRDDLAALIAVRGGYGVMRILDAIDYDAASLLPKLIVGYSDITALQFALYTMCGWTAIQGPMVAVEWPTIDPASESQFWQLADGNVLPSLAGPSDEQLAPVREGTNEGMLLGGNLAAIVRLIGTPYLPSLEGAILYLEDVGEPPYRIDALLAQMRLSGLLQQLGGVVLGAFERCDPVPDRPSFTTEQVLRQYFEDAAYPVAEGLVFGHIRRKISMPFGVKARLTVTATEANLAMLEPVASG